MSRSSIGGYVPLPEPLSSVVFVLFHSSEALVFLGVGAVRLPGPLSLFVPPPAQHGWLCPPLSPFTCLRTLVGVYTSLCLWLLFCPLICLPACLRCLSLCFRLSALAFCLAGLVTVFASFGLCLALVSVCLQLCGGGRAFGHCLNLSPRLRLCVFHFVPTYLPTGPLSSGLSGSEDFGSHPFVWDGEFSHPIAPRASVDRSYVLEKVSNSVLWRQVNRKFLVEIMR